jgi:type II secretory pathway pseudopilin PulG
VSDRRDNGGSVPGAEDRRRSEAGDTLVEILIALTVLGIAATAILLAFATSISGSGEDRNLVTMDTMLRTASAEVTSAIQQQSSTVFSSCSGAYTLNQQGISLPNASAPATNPYSAAITGAQYWNAAATPPAFTSTVTPTTSCPAGVTGGGPQLLTVTVTYHGGGGITSSTITTVVDNTTPPTPATNCANTPLQLVWVSQPGGGNAGTALFPAPTLAIENQSGCVELNDASAVALSVNSGPGTLHNCVALGSGETTFQNCTIATPGQYTLIAKDTTDGITSIASDPFTITQGIPIRLVFGTQPGNGTGGSPLSPQPAVFIEDNSGNVVPGDSSTVTLAIGNNPGSGTLSGCSSTTVNGVATFAGCKIDKVGTGYTLTATDVADNLTTGTTSSPFNITPGPAYQLAFATTPGTTVAGDPFGTQPIVNILDAGGNQTTSTDTRPPARTRAAARPHRPAWLPSAAAPSASPETATHSWRPTRLLRRC